MERDKTSFRTVQSIVSPQEQKYITQTMNIASLIDF